ncbi:MAG: lysophospholipid acyltransferase family protein [Deltaproteobacteria bacterium]|nr:lysophospholipid acyltransferase family protein [Deltaproteobacteria bacterium]
MNLLTKLSGEILYIFIYSLIFLMRALPYRLAIAIGRFFGILAWISLPLHRRISQMQINHSLQGVNPRMMTLKVFMHQGDIFIDTVRFAFINEAELKKKILIEGREHIESAVASDRGVMMITGHMNWEILGHIPRVLGFTFSIMGDIIKNPKIQSIVEDMRSRCGFTLLPPKGGMLSLITDELKNGRVIGIVIDQRGKRENRVFCNVFGMPAPTSPAPALMALRGDALIQPVSAVKEGDTYIFRFEKTIDSREFGDDFKQVETLDDCWKSRAIKTLSQDMQSWISTYVKRCPQQYFWLHSRWLRRSDMKRIIKSGGDFTDSVRIQAEHYLDKG